MLGAFAYLASYIDGYFNFDDGTLLDGYAGSAARFAGWTLYAFAAGTVGMGVWVIGHECGCNGRIDIVILYNLLTCASSSFRRRPPSLLHLKDIEQYYGTHPSFSSLGTIPQLENQRKALA
jgi:hypothetical protein